MILSCPQWQSNCLAVAPLKKTLSVMLRSAGIRSRTRTLAMSSVHGTHASLRGESIDASNNAGTRTCCVHVKLEGKFAMGSLLPNRARAFSLATSDETIVLDTFCVHPWSGCANLAEEAESSRMVRSNRNRCAGMVLIWRGSIADVLKKRSKRWF